MIKQKVLKIKKGMLDEWKSWCQELQNERYDDAHLTLIEEGLEYEIAGIFNVKDEYYVIATMCGKCIPSDKNKEINQIHIEKRKKCLELVSDVDILYHIKK